MKFKHLIISSGGPAVFKQLGAISLFIEKNDRV